MPEEIKNKILNFLKSHKQKFSITQISKELGISYSTTLKWVEVLIVEGSIKVEDWGNLKLIWYEE
jgi:Mn-dependent DtxR family transcriptional regulator